MNKNYLENNVDISNLYVAENDGLELDYEEIRAGIESSREDFRCGRYYDIKTSMEITRRMLFEK